MLYILYRNDMSTDTEQLERQDMSVITAVEG